MATTDRIAVLSKESFIVKNLVQETVMELLRLGQINPFAINSDAPTP